MDNQAQPGLAMHDPHQGRLTPGMVVTLEPGIHVPSGAPVDPAFWSLRVRIEDTFVVTANGGSALTDYPRQP